MPTLWIDTSELRSSSLTRKYLANTPYTPVHGLEKLTGADIALSISDTPPITPYLISSPNHRATFFIQVKHGGDVLGTEQRWIELERMVNVVPEQSQRYLLQVGRADDFWREKAIHRNWNRFGVTDFIENGSLFPRWLEMLANMGKSNIFTYRPIPKHRHKINIISDYRRSLLSLPGVGLKTVLSLKANNWHDAIIELIEKDNKLSERIKRYLSNDK